MTSRLGTNWGFVALFACAILIASPVAAQSLISTSLTAELVPRYPEPNADVQITLKSSVIDLESAAIVWRVNGEIVREGEGINTAVVRTGALGSRTEVTAEASSEIGGAITTVVLIPAEIDLLWESDSYTPPFYDGRSQPSVGRKITLQAFPRLKSGGGADVPAANLVYTWKRNGAPIPSLSGTGKSRATIAAPAASDTIEVEARTADRSVAAAASVRISSVEPTLLLYPNHPLFGIMFHDALMAQSDVFEDELSFTAIPYFADAASAGESALTYEWTVNGTSVPVDTTAPNTITIDATGSTGRADVELTVSHASNMFMHAVGAWRIMFTNISELIDDPFGPNR